MEHIDCALCRGSHTDLLFTKWEMNIVRCTGCGLVYVNPRKFAVEDDSYYREAYLSTIEQYGELQPGIRYLYGRFADHIETLVAPSRLLVVGCAMGHFMKFAKSRGWNVHGVECSPFAAAYGRERWGLPIQTACDLRKTRLPGSFFDACSMIEVVEHLPHPKETLLEVFRLLKPGGVLYMTTPNFASYMAIAQRENWAAVVPTGHLYHFTAETLGALARSAGFTVTVDLTESAALESEMERIPPEQRLDAGSLESLRETCAAEEEGRIANGRAEELVLYAVKPFSGPAPLFAARRWTGPEPDLDGRLVCGSGASAEDQKVYLIGGGKKHWVTSESWLEAHGMSLSAAIRVDSRLLAAIISGPPLG
ncbi:MAG: methyltransferase domain-containing protein [Acidobacteriota bacterium]